MRKTIVCTLLLVLSTGLKASAEMRFRLSADSDEVIGETRELDANEAVKVIVPGTEADIDILSSNGEAEYIENNILYFNVFTPGDNGGRVEVRIDFSGFEGNKIYKVFAIPVLSSNESGPGAELTKDHTEIGYARLSDRLRYAQDIKNALSAGTAKLALELEAKGIYLGIDLTMYRLSSPEGVAAIMSAEPDKAELAADVRTLVEFIDDSVIVDVLNGRNSGRITPEYLEGLIVNDERFADIEEAFMGIPTGQRARILTGISQQGFSSFGELKQQLVNSVVINAFNYTDTNAEKLYKLLYDFRLKVDPEIDIAPLSQMGSAARSNAVKNLSGKKYATISELKKAIAEVKYQDTVINAPQGGGGGGGGGGGSGGGGSVGKLDLPRIEEGVPGGSSTGVTAFTDMDKYKWAEDALYYLAQKNIIAGYDDKTFRPENNITRAEFVKIVVSCFFNTDSAYELTFADVGKEKWYYKYIASAVENKIVSGLSDMEFGPDSYITRQDMAVVLYNTAQVIGFEMETDEADIEDSEDISDYARAAVYALKNTEVINGYDDGSFKPKSNANRAETVQMIYNFLIKKGEFADEEDF